jgi:hypothetical protein
MEQRRAFVKRQKRVDRQAAAIVVALVLTILAVVAWAISALFSVPFLPVMILWPVAILVVVAIFGR